MITKTCCAVMMLAAGSAWASDVAVSDFSFENYSVGTGGLAYQYTADLVGYTPGWTFGAGTGLAAWNSNFNPPTPVDGNQVGFLQNNGSTISQSLGGLDSTLAYTLDIWVGSRFHNDGYTGDAGVSFFIDGVQIGSTGILPSFSPFTEYQIPFLVTTDGAHTLALTNTSGAGDRTAFVDGVNLTSTAPEPATFGLLGTMLVALGVVRCRRA